MIGNEFSDSEWNVFLIFSQYPKQDVLQNGIIEQCLMQFFGFPATVLHRRISQVDILLTKMFTENFANGETIVL